MRVEVFPPQVAPFLLARLLHPLDHFLCCRRVTPANNRSLINVGREVRLGVVECMPRQILFDGGPTKLSPGT